MKQVTKLHLNHVGTFRRHLLAASLGLAATAALGQPSFAPQSNYPDKPIRFVVGFAAGGSADVVARAIALELTKTLGQPVTVDNKPGAGAHIATQALLSAPADGYTILFAGLTLATNPALLGNLGYNPDKDLVMVSQLTAIPVVVFVPAKSPINNMQDLIAASKAKPEGLTFGSGGTGTSSHLGPELLSRTVGFKYTHVPYRGGAPALQGLLSGDTDAMFDIAVTPMHRANVEAGKIKFIGVMQKDPISSYTSIKPAGQQGIPPAAFMRSWQGIAVKQGTSPAIVGKLHASISAALKNPEVINRLIASGAEVQGSKNPEEFQKLYQQELVRWTGLIKAAGIKAE
ncbi:MAG TPA: tripartite tricarboxylate transporter substrate binding protein [Polaromonas sp.]|uniref:Bug family tripartite tricarboxylate transporter substrate binding protein n=1 Tax=Polaromonas sp. TaxID=1869339 RepID=UPI002D405D4D|nr:tripartite tricarboxylate transporter substrate binding protein [Polaromonas sp.]HYW55350.1 tripartite tricarboxylate transporter substrate binding protein [Polaromonas sp.]